MNEKEISIREAYRLLTEKGKTEGFKTICTLFIPSRNINDTLDWGSFKNVSIKHIIITGGNSGKKVSTPLPSPMPGVDLLEYYISKEAPQKYLNANLTNPSLDTLRDVAKIAKRHGMKPEIRRTICENNGSLYDFIHKRPLGIENPISIIHRQSSAHTAGTSNIYVLDLQKEHDLYRLENIKDIFPHSRIRLCSLKSTTGRETSCLFV